MTLTEEEKSKIEEEEKLRGKIQDKQYGKGMLIGTVVMIVFLIIIFTMLRQEKTNYGVKLGGIYSKSGAS